MKKFFTLCAIVLVSTFSNAQVVLNEVYTDPGSGKQEFFELYNSSTNPVPENLDNYTLVTYYEETGGKVGFYILDLPTGTVITKGYYISAGTNPFNVQGQTNVPAAFSWQTIPAGGSLTKWEKSGSSYVQVAIPANLNDLFVKASGTGASYHIFLYKNGILVNGLIGGTNSTVIPGLIKAMPNLFVDMSGASPDFTINFSSIADNQVEYTTANTGNDNGYTREFDGKCGSWKKSSSQASHTPGMTNGSATGATGVLTITATLTSYVPDPTKNVLDYNITTGPVEAFPVVVEVYTDLGIFGELDASDILVNTKTINNAASGNQTVIMPTTDPVMLIAKSAAGCLDRVMSVEMVAAAALPVHLTRFQGNLNKNNKVSLNWTAAENETVEHFEVERSVNGKDFTSAAVVFSTDKYGTEDYQYAETINSNDKVMYRLKMFDNGHDVDYSKILVFQTRSSNSTDIKIYGNPVNDKLTFSYTSDATHIVLVKVYDAAGKILMSQKVNSLEGSNMMSLPLNSTFKPGLYVVEVTTGTESQFSKFIKQ